MATGDEELARLERELEDPWPSVSPGPVTVGSIKDWILGEVRRELGVEAVRDAAANAALSGLLAGEKVEGTWAAIARDAYSAADAMLAVRVGWPATPVEDAAGLAERLALKACIYDLRAFIAVMFGTGPDATIAETIRSPLGVDIKLGDLWRQSEAVLGSAAVGSEVGDVPSGV